MRNGTTTEEVGMKLLGKRVLVTGAGGGIGSSLVRVLLHEGADVMLTGRDSQALHRLVARLGADRERTTIVPAELTKAADHARLCEVAATWRGGIDVLVNNAATSDFSFVSEQSVEAIERMLATNLLAPMLLCRQLLPVLTDRPSAHIVNVGSVFGSIGFAGNAVYSATKFGLRGFSEALRRELANTSVRVHHFAPRATRTSLNDSAVDEMNAALGTAVDDPFDVARQIVATLKKGRLESVFGWPEKFFARMNAVLPRVVDSALRKQLDTIQRYARRSGGETPSVQLISRRKVG
jgi:short-subunit dehydrogenase